MTVLFREHWEKTVEKKSSNKSSTKKNSAGKANTRLSVCDHCRWAEEMNMLYNKEGLGETLGS